MKKVKLFLLVAILCTSCSKQKFITSGIQSVEINDMLKIQPFAYISLIEKGNRDVFNDSISSNTKIILNESLEMFREKLHLSSEELNITDTHITEELKQEIDLLISSVQSNKDIKNIPITPLIESLLNTNEKRFGLIIVQYGFTRVKGNYGGQIVKGIGIGILTGLLTGVSVYQNPIKANSTLHAIIVDNQNKNVAFYNKSVLQDNEPTKKENIIKQLNKIFENYFWKKQ